LAGVEHADFRAKFLALLPIASGTGLFLVFKDGDKALSTPQVNAIGWLGLAATVGLAIHEYHAIRDCLVLMRGQELERALGLGEGLSDI
jgi:hypothetical protein